MKRPLLITIAIVLVSCGVKKNLVEPKNYTFYIPELNVISNEEIGVTLVKKENGFYYDAIKITKTFKTKLGYELKTVEAGTTFINYHQTKNYYLFSNSNYKKFGIAIPKSGGLPLLFTTNAGGTGIYSSNDTSTVIRFKEIDEKIEFNNLYFLEKKKEYFKKEFIYNGRIGNGLKFIYREFINDYARPSFSQDLQYDLSESKIIGFRELRIEIINTTNTTIEYKVLEHLKY